MESKDVVVVDLDVFGPLLKVLAERPSRTVFVRPSSACNSERSKLSSMPLSPALLRRSISAGSGCTICRHKDSNQGKSSCCFFVLVSHSITSASGVSD